MICDAVVSRLLPDLFGNLSPLAFRLAREMRRTAGEWEGAEEEAQNIRSPPASSCGGRILDSPAFVAFKRRKFCLIPQPTRPASVHQSWLTKGGDLCDLPLPIRRPGYDLLDGASGGPVGSGMR